MDDPGGRRADRASTDARRAARRWKRVPAPRRAVVRPAERPVREHGGELVREGEARQGRERTVVDVRPDHRVHAGSTSGRLWTSQPRDLATSAARRCVQRPGWTGQKGVPAASAPGAIEERPDTAGAARGAIARPGWRRNVKSQ